jgi:hypothetical protein
VAANQARECLRIPFTRLGNQPTVRHLFWSMQTSGSFSKARDPQLKTEQDCTPIRAQQHNLC